MDEQQLRETLASETVGDSFTKLCRLFGGGGSNAFWHAVCAHEHERASSLCDVDPIVPQRTRDWLNRDAGIIYLPSIDEG